MRAAVCRAVGGPLVLEELRLDSPGPGEVRVQVAACAICHSDIAFIDGAWGGTLPAVYGHEAAGVVREVGPGVDGLRAGDHVAVTMLRSCGRCPTCSAGKPAYCEGSVALDGRTPLSAADGSPVVQGLGTAAFAEEVVVDASQVVALPPELPLEEASLLSCGVITGVGAVTNSARVRAGESAVVVGTGGVGLNVVQGAALVGAQPIIAVDLADEKLEAARRLGATHAANPARDDVPALVRDWTGGRGADHVFVAVGANSALESALPLLARAGELVIVGMPPNGTVTGFDPTELAYYGQRIVGSRLGGARIRVDIPSLVEQRRRGRLRLGELISGRYPLEEINEAIASVRRGEALRHVIVLDGAG